MLKGKQKEKNYIINASFWVDRAKWRVIMEEAADTFDEGWRKGDGPFGWDLYKEEHPEIHK